MTNYYSRNDTANDVDEVDKQPKDGMLVVLTVVVIIAALTIPFGMIFTGRGGAVFAMLLLIVRLFLIALPLYLVYRTVRLLLQKEWKAAGTLAIVTLVVAIVCALVFALLIPVTIQ
ncbi:MAG: hypothetical protein ABWX90_00300 [Candidatus Saccharimonadales bacterium]